MTQDLTTTPIIMCRVVMQQQQQLFVQWPSFDQNVGDSIAMLLSHVNQLLSACCNSNTGGCLPFNLQGASAKIWCYTKTAIEQSWCLESGHLYSYFNDSCRLTKTKLKRKHFKMNYLLVLNLFFKCFFIGKILTVKFLLTHPVSPYLHWLNAKWSCRTARRHKLTICQSSRPSSVGRPLWLPHCIRSALRQGPGPVLLRYFLLQR